MASTTIGEPGLEARIKVVRRRIERAALRAGRDPATVGLIAVSKTRSADTVVAAYRAGLHVFGENRVEEAAPKAGAVVHLLSPGSAPVWHMIGHVQSRKAAEVLSWASMVHSVDSAKLARRLSRFSAARGTVLPILLEVNVAGESSKYGLAPGDLPRAIDAIAVLPGLRLEGLMTMAPIAEDPETVRPVFAQLHLLKDNIARRYPSIDWRHLSMGMSDDFEVAIEEGATLVRLGRAIFG